MKKTIATLGILGLGMMGAAASANAAPDGKITICHATGATGNPYVPETISLNALVAHTNDTLDIVPANAGDIMPLGQNLTAANLATLANACVAVAPPVDHGPVTDTGPGTNPGTPIDTGAPTTVPESVPAAVPEAVPVAAPVGAVVAAPAVPVVAAPAPARQVLAAPAQNAAAAVPAKVNMGYNVQTAASHTPEGLPAWLFGLTGVFAAGSAVVLWRGAARARNAL